MGLIVVADVSHPDLALIPTIRSTGAALRVLPHTGTDAETGTFPFSVELDGLDTGAFEAALEEDPTVAAYGRLSRSEEVAVYQMSYTDGTKLVSPRAVEAGGVVRDTESTDRDWRMTLQFPDREALAALWEFCDAEDIGFEVRQLYRQEGWTGGDGGGLTEAQRTALLTAYRNGYFDEPRGTSLEELAEELDISPTAVGGRIRRGVAKLVETTIAGE